MQNRYARQIGLSGFCEESVVKLKNTKIVVIGAGGVGSAALPLLAGAGVGKIVVADGDVVSVSNLHRQTFYTESGVAKSKARLAAMRLNEINSEISATFVEKYFYDEASVEEIVRGADLCIDATDNFRSRILISEVCLKCAVPEILSSAGGYLSQLYMLGGGISFGFIVGDVNAKYEGSMGLPIFGPAAHLSGVWGAGTAIRVAVGAQKFEPGTIQSFDFSSGKFLKFKI